MIEKAKPRLLIVEDEVIVVADLAIRLGQMGYEVAGSTARAEEALAMVEELRPDLVLMDIHLQGEMDGITAAREVHCRYQVPVVFLTAYGEGVTFQRAKEAEPFGYLLKPIEDRELRIVIEIALYKHQSELKLREFKLELEQRVADRTAELEVANKELEAFCYSVSHDLRAPLRAVDGYARILVEDHAADLNPEGQRVCEVIQQSARDMSQLIDDLLEFARFGRMSMKLTTVDMAALAQSVFLDVTGPAERERIDFRVGAIPSASADPTLLKQVWFNLLANAVKFSAKQARAIIEVSASESGEEMVYSVRDNGAGFDLRFADKLFGVFQRLHRANEFEGTGVGLAIVRRIIERHGGRTWAEGSAGHGATFYFSLHKP